MSAKKSAPKQIILNEEQQAVVNAREGCWCVMSGPGSGKTACATSRYAALIREGVSPDQVLALSFTATAAKNLKGRVEEQVGQLSTTRTAGSMTLHSLALKFAVEEKNEFPFELDDFPLATEPVANSLSAKAAQRYEVDSRSLRSAISLFKRNRIRPGQAIRAAEESLNAKDLKIALAYKDADKRMREAKLLDFDSLMFEMVDLMEKKSAVRARWQYQYVICDEAQDCCKTDFSLLKLLTEQHKSLMCVGDPGQNIYSFRGSDSRLFRHMEETFPGTQKLYLATNYRSTKERVKFLREIGPVPELAEKFHTPNELGVKPEVRGFITAGDEAAWIVKSIKEGLCQTTTS